MSNNIQSDDLKKRIHDTRHEPTRAMSLTLDLLESSLIDQQGFVLDPSQPLPFLIENDVVLTHAAVESIEASTIRQYPIMAQTDDDLYLHMSDADMVGMFATPGENTFILMISKSELELNAVSIDESQSRKITIPKHTQILINGLHFTMQYPIDIVIKSHGGIEVSYDGTVDSPIQALAGTKINWEIVRLPSSIVGNLPNEYLRIDVPVKQVRLTSYKNASTPASLFKQHYEFEDQFVTARVYIQNQTGWREIRTTLSDHTFDPYDLTMQMKVTDNILTVELPYVYQATAAASAQYRVDIYSTKGDIFMDLTGIANGHRVTFQDMDNTLNGRYYAPMSRLDTFSVISTGIVSGGNDGMSFEERRSRMLMNNVGVSSKPISPSQVEGVLTTLGFDVTLNQDDVLARTFQVSRDMPIHNYGLTTTPIDSAVMTAKSSIEGLVTFQTVRDNDEQVTIMPETLYEDVGGMLIIVPDDERMTLDQMRGDFKVNALTTNRYLYTPLHYVLDLSSQRIDARPYYLTNPSMGVAGYSDSNDTVPVFVQMSDDAFIEYDQEGYLITVRTDSNEPYKALRDDQLYVQLAFQPDVENEWVYINGTLLSSTDEGERVWQFRIATDWLVRADHQLTLTNFTMRVDEPQLHDTPLTGEWYVVWSCNDYVVDGMGTSGVDDVLGKHLLPDDAIGIYRESVQIRFGDELSGLWRRARPMIGTIAYRTYDYDIPLLHESNVYDRLPDGTPIIVEVDGKRQLKVLYAKGTPVINPDTGEPEYLYRKGQPMRDVFGELIPEDDRKVTYWWDVVLFDAQYRYVTRELDVDYSTTVANILVEWVNDTLKPIRDMALDRTEFSFHPRNSLKYINVLVDDGRTDSIYTAQRLVVDLYLNDQAYREPELREVLAATARTTLHEVIGRNRVSTEDINAALKVALGDDLVTSSVSGLGGGDYKVITLLDSTTRLCIAKILSVESDGSLSIKDDININFKRHGI